MGSSLKRRWDGGVGASPSPSPSPREVVSAAKACADPFGGVDVDGEEAVRPLGEEGGEGCLWHCSASDLGEERREAVFELTKRHMAPVYGPAWKDAAKRRELFAPSARYVVSPGPGGGSGPALKGFVHFRFVVDQGVAVVYVYELQVDVGARGKGLGSRLMALMEKLAHRHGLSGVVLTVQHLANPRADAFYRQALGYVPHPLCPTQSGFKDGGEAPAYAILAKWRDKAAEAKLEEAAKKVRAKEEEGEEEGSRGEGGKQAEETGPPAPRRTPRQRTS